MITPDLSILNQLGTPMFYSDVTANRPTAGILGRIFIATDSPYGVFRDNGSSWDQIAGSGGGGGITGSGTPTRIAFWDTTSSISSNANLYWDNTNSRLGINTATPGAPLDVHGTGTAAHFNGTGTNNTYLLFQNAGTGKWQIGNTYSAGANYFRIYDSVNATERLKIENTGSITTGATITASGSSTGYQGIYNSNSVTIPASTTFASGGYTFVGYNQYYFQNFGGSATFQNNNIDASIFGLNRIDFSGAGGTITMTQATGVRAMSAAAFQNQYNGTNSGTITNLAGAVILGFYRSAGAGTLSVTNAYGLIINNIDDYGAGFSYTNRWGIFQQGSSDNNYFSGKIITGSSTTVSTYQLDVTGTSRFSSDGVINSVNFGTGNNTPSNAENTAFGFQAGLVFPSTGSSRNSAFGYRAGTALNTGSYNTLIGAYAGNQITAQTDNVAVGVLANSTNNTYGNVSVGSSAHKQLTGGSNVAIGLNAGYYRVDGNVDIGAQAGFSASANGSLNVAIGFSSGKYAGDYKLYIASNPATYGNLVYGDFTTGQFKINDTNTPSLTASAQFEIVSTTRGFLPPRMTTTQKNAISSPATGLVIFDTTLAKLCVYTGAAWQTVTSV
jgi:hypothetical protein